MTILPWLPLTGPLLLALIGLVPSGREPRRLADLGAAVALVALASAALVLVVPGGVLRTPTVGLAGVGLSGYLDGLSATMLALVSFVGAVVLRFSRNYLDGDPRHGAFLRTLALTLAAVLAMVVSGNLALTGLAWLATGVGLRRLLTFYRHRPAAMLCARKNLLVSRTADLLLLVAAILLWRAAGSLDYAHLFARAAEWRNAVLPLPVSVAAVLVALAALLKSAQIPVHGWLLEVMETPTPVSALLHAGIINGGGFLVLRLSPVVDQVPGALALLAVVGAATAIAGSLVMLTQTSVKVSLAWSTVAQMGFMMLELGLGAYAAALLHVVAHSLYKAHAFLSSGSVVELARAAWSPAPGERPHPGRLGLALAGAVVIALTVGRLFGADLVHAPGVVVLGAVLVFGLTQLLAQAIDARPSAYVLVRAAGLAIALAVTWFGLQAASERLLIGVLPVHVAAASPLAIALAVSVIAAFAALTLLQVVAVGHVDGPCWRALHAHMANGLYLNTLANRWVLRLWPRPPQPLAAPADRNAGASA